MKKIVALLLCVCFLALAGCEETASFTLTFAVPAENETEYVFAGEEIYSEKGSVTLEAGAGVVRAQVILVPAEGAGDEVGPLELVQREDLTVQLTPGVWYRLGLQMENESDAGAAAAEVTVTGTKLQVRIE